MYRHRYNYHGRPPRRKVICPVDGSLCSEHVMTVFRLYDVDHMSLRDIAALYGVTFGSIWNMINRVRRSIDKPDDIQAARYAARAEQYGEALRLLDEKRNMCYAAISAQTHLPPHRVKEIARRNGLER